MLPLMISPVVPEISDTTTVSLSVIDTTFVVAPFESSNLSPSTSSLVNLDAIPSIVSLLELPSTVTVPCPVIVKSVSYTHLRAHET